MLYKVAFDETWSLLDDVGHPASTFLDFFTESCQSAKKLFEAGKALLNTKHFKELLSVSTSICDLSTILTPC
jgi:cytokinesis protein